MTTLSRAWRRRLLLAGVSAFLVLPAATVVAQAIAHARQAVRTAVADPIVRVSAVGPVGITVSDMTRALAFYTGVLPFTKVSDQVVGGRAFAQLQGVVGARARVVQLALGEERIELTEYLSPRGRPVPADSRSQDRWFQHVAIIVSSMDSAYAILRRHNVEHASIAPQRLPDWNPNAGGIKAFYFKDPDHHVLEILQFPDGKGLDKWHRTDALFLGIDHTAIVAGDTEASLAFYRDALGLRIAGTSENWGEEQARLNNVVGAHLRITALRADTGPGIELLEYLAPRDGRPYPADARSNDLVHWHTQLVVTDATRAAAALGAAHIPLLSPGALLLPDQRLGFSRAFQVRDPDGHVMQLTERK